MKTSRLLLAGFGLSVMVICLAVQARAGDCDPVPELFAEEGAEFRGLYENGSWEYAVRIPKHFAGYDNSAGPQHGFGLILGKSKTGYIFVNGEANSLEYEGPFDAAIHSFEYDPEDEGTIVTVTIARSRLGGLPARRLTMTYTCPGSAKRFVRVSIFAFSPARGFAYEVALYSRARDYQRNRTVFDQMVRTWRYTGRHREAAAKSSCPAAVDGRGNGCQQQ